jgi:5'-nucleotidase
VGEDPQIKQLLAPFAQDVQAAAVRSIAKVPRDLLHLRRPGSHTSGVYLERGSQVVPLVGAAMKWKLETLRQGVDAVLFVGGGIRTDISAGDFSVKNAFEILPFNNSLVAFSISSAQFAATLDDALDSDGGFPYLYGMPYRIDMTKAKGQRITFQGNKAQSEMLRIGAPSYLLTGGDGYKFEGISKIVDTGFFDNEVFMEYAGSVGTLLPDQRGDLEFIRLK